jgi:pimeloyl-ACP methyl ester carboxylesterase
MKMRLMLLGLAIAALVPMLSCSKDDDNHLVEAKTFVLVHGAWQAPFVWDSVKTGLEKTGAHVVVVQLPGHGVDTAAPQTLSIDVYRDKVISVLAGVQGKVILVGHSLGGMVISAVAEKVPSRIEKLVYLGAFLPASGQSLLDLASTDADSQLGSALVPSADQLTLNVMPDKLIGIFIQDGTDAAKALALSNYRAEPAIPFTNKVTLTPANFGSVPKVYIKTLQDHAISSVLQSRMITAASIQTIYQLNTSHTAMLAKPDSVSSLLITISH